jgi:hypothetical protein
VALRTAIVATALEARARAARPAAATPATAPVSRWAELARREALR